MQASTPLDDAIAAGVADLRQELPVGAVVKLARLLAELERWNRRINLTAIRDPEAMVSGHVLDSLAIRGLLGGRRILDIGTGAGFPGLPLAIAEPGLSFELLDSNARKIGFVRHIIGELRLDNATPVNARAEDYAPAERFDTVIARALASVPKILKLAGHLVKEGGVLLALKGKDPAAELVSTMELSGWNYVVTKVTVPGLESHARHVVCLHKQIVDAA